MKHKKQVSITFDWKAYRQTTGETYHSMACRIGGLLLPAINISLFADPRGWYGSSETPIHFEPDLEQAKARQEALLLAKLTSK